MRYPNGRVRLFQNQAVATNMENIFASLMEVREPRNMRNIELLQPLERWICTDFHL